MQVPPPQMGVPLQTANSWPSITPGPIVLLLLLPSLPLLLFGIGARPPNMRHLPFDHSDIWTTSALVTCALAVVLGVTVWPDGLSGIMGWVQGGPQTWVSPDSRGVGKGSAAPYFGKADVGARSHYMHQGASAGGHNQAILTMPAQKRAILPPRAALHTHALRSAFAPWYDPAPPHFPTGLFVMAVTLLLLFLGIGHLLGAAYDHEPTKRPSSATASDKDKGKPKGSDKQPGRWVKTEYTKREEERGDPEKTIARVQKDHEKERKAKKARQEAMKPQDFEKWRKAEEKRRVMEIDQLKKLLEKEGLPLVALGTGDESTQKDPTPQGDGKETTSAEREESSTGSSGSGIGGKMKNAWLGTGIGGDLAKRWKEAGEVVAGKNGISRDAGTAKEKTGGPGWEPANQAVVDATLMQSAMNAEGNAEKLKAGMKAK